MSHGAQKSTLFDFIFFCFNNKPLKGKAEIKYKSAMRNIEKTSPTCPEQSGVVKATACYSSPPSCSVSSPILCSNAAEFTV